MHTTPPSLLLRLREPGEQQAWTRFVQLYTPLLLHWAKRWGLQSQDAADLAQEVCLTLVQKLPEFQYDQQHGFRHWLHTVAFNKWRDLCRRRQVRERAENEVNQVPVSNENEELIEREYREHLVSRALQLMQAEFAPNMWQACWQHVVVGRTAAAVAAELGIAEGTVYVAKARILLRLREELAGLLD